MELVEGAVIAGRFRLNRKLGQGGMGSVWHATHMGLDVPCALKFIEGEIAALPEAQARFEREAKAAAQLRSAHVVQILDHGISDGRPYIAMELLDGEDLGKRLARVGRLSLADTSAIITQVCRALTKAHALGIVHRDLKPDNIFLVREDDHEIAKVLDFGIAKSMQSGLETGSATKTGSMLGTPYYMSPEQAQGVKSVDSRSDLWSLAIIVFQCVTGHLPFHSEALGDLLVRIIVSELPVPSSLGPVPAGFDAWWAKAATRAPEQRFQTAKELAESLHAVLVGQGGAFEHPSTPQLAVATPRDRQPSFDAIPTAPRVPTQVVSSPASAPSAHASTGGTPSVQTFGGFGEATRPPERRSKSGVFVAFGVACVVIVGGGFFALRHGEKNDPTAGAPSAKLSATAAPEKVPEKPVETPTDKVAEKPVDVAPEKAAAKVDKPTEPSIKTPTPKEEAKAESKTRRNKAPPPPAPAPSPAKAPAKPQSDVEKMGF